MSHYTAIQPWQGTAAAISCLRIVDIRGLLTVTAGAFELVSMEFPDDLVWVKPAEDRRECPVTSRHRLELDSRLAACQRDKNRGRIAADVLADIRRRLLRALAPRVDV